MFYSLVMKYTFTLSTGHKIAASISAILKPVRSLVNFLSSLTFLGKLLP